MRLILTVLFLSVCGFAQASDWDDAIARHIDMAGIENKKATSVIIPAVSEPEPVVQEKVVVKEAVKEVVREVVVPAPVVEAKVVPTMPEIKPLPVVAEYVADVPAVPEAPAFPEMLPVIDYETYQPVAPMPAEIYGETYIEPEYAEPVPDYVAEYAQPRPEEPRVGYIELEPMFELKPKVEPGVEEPIVFESTLPEPEIKSYHQDPRLSYIGDNPVDFYAQEDFTVPEVVAYEAPEVIVQPLPEYEVIDELTVAMTEQKTAPRARADKARTFYIGVQEEKSAMVVDTRVVPEPVIEPIMATDEKIVITPKSERKEVYVEKQERPLFKEHETAIGLSLSSYKYEESPAGLSISIEGDKWGGFLDHTIRPQDTGLMIRGELAFNRGDVDYDGFSQNADLTVSPLQVDGEEDTKFEIRGLVGGDFHLSNDFAITPYLGLGYRYLENDPGRDFVFSEAAGGNVLLYRRESNYWYLPIGVDLTKRARSLTFTLNGELDILLYGKQISHLGVEVENEQNEGYGLRGSLKIQKDLNRIGLFIEPYIEYWDIQDSDFGTVSGQVVPLLIEPANTTTETGLRAGITF